MLELNKIYCMDCLEGLKQLEDNSVDITITSPPYNMCNTEIEVLNDSKYMDYKDNMDVFEYYNWIKSVLTELIRVSKKYVFFNIQMLSGNKQAVLLILSDFREQLKDIQIWVKKNPAPNISPQVLSKSWEFILVFDKDNQNGSYNKDKNIKRSIPDSFIKTVNSDNNFKDVHKAVFPNWLPQHFIKNFSDEDDVVLDCFNGVGTTTYYAKLNNRRFIGFDISEEYCEIARKRLEQSNLLNLS